MYEFCELLLHFDGENRRKRQCFDHRSLFPSLSQITSRLLRRLECVAWQIVASHCGRGPTEFRARGLIGVQQEIWSHVVQENRVSRWQRLNSKYLLTKWSFWLGLWHDISISWHGGKELYRKYGMFCQQCHPSVAPGDADIRQRIASLFLHLPFVYVIILSISPLWRTGETNPLGRTSKMTNLGLQL